MTVKVCFIDVEDTLVISKREKIHSIRLFSIASSHPLFSNKFSIDYIFTNIIQMWILLLRCICDETGQFGNKENTDVL